jgi:regulator of replication initiation timing
LQKYSRARKASSKETIYYVGTNDYLSNGDNMNFFKKGVQKFDLQYKLRNILIDYFKEGYHTCNKGYQNYRRIKNSI